MKELNKDENRTGLSLDEIRSKLDIEKVSDDLGGLVNEQAIRLIEDGEYVITDVGRKVVERIYRIYQKHEGSYLD
jgi:hypothetical protein